MDWEPRDDEIIPAIFPDYECQGKTFLWVYNHRREFCDFVRDQMYNTKGFWKVFQTYVNERNGVPA
jgi:fatty-acid desaturase